MLLLAGCSKPGIEAPSRFTNTGIACDGETLWLGDFTNQRCVQLSREGKELRSFPVQGKGIQGVAFDSGTLWVANYREPIVRQYSIDGQAIRSLDSRIEANGIAVTGPHVWISPYKGGEIACLDKLTGDEVRRVTLAGVEEIDGLFITADAIWTTTDDAIVRKSAMSGETLFQFTASTNIEHLAIDRDGSIWVNCDAEHHSKVPNGNRFFHYSSKGRLIR